MATNFQFNFVFIFVESGYVTEQSATIYRYRDKTMDVKLDLSNFNLADF